MKRLKTLLSILPLNLLAFFSGCASLGMIQERLVPRQMEDGKVLFRYYSPSARTITPAGDFNGWEHRQDQSRTIHLRKNEKDVWEVAVPLQEGRYRYKYVLDYQSWVLDPNNPLTEDDGTGNFNSLLIIK